MTPGVQVVSTPQVDASAMSREQAAVRYANLIKRYEETHPMSDAVQEVMTGNWLRLAEEIKTRHELSVAERASAVMEVFGIPQEEALQKVRIIDKKISDRKVLFGNLLNGFSSVELGRTPNPMDAAEKAMGILPRADETAAALEAVFHMPNISDATRASIIRRHGLMLDDVHVSESERGRMQALLDANPDPATLALKRRSQADIDAEYSHL